MRVYNYVYPKLNYTYFPDNKQNQNRSKISFSGVTIPKTYGILSVPTQQSLKNLHENMDFIHDIFLKFAHYPQKAIAIKNGFSELIQKNRNSGISFKLPDNQGILIIRRLLKNPNLMRFIVEKDGKLTHFLTDGYDKSIANVNQNNPQFLPRTFRYMLPDEIKSSNIEKYIVYTDEKIQKYRTYLEQFNGSGNSETSSVMTSLKKHNTEKMRKYRASKNQNVVTEAKHEIKKTYIKEIMSLFQMNPKDFPEHIKPVLSPANSVLGFSLQTSDGATLKVNKKLNAKYGGNMAYLSFEKIFPDGNKSYMSIDLQSHKFLKMKDLGKPLIRNHSVYEYDKEEIIKRNMVGKFETYFKEIFREEKKPQVPEIKAETVIPETKPDKIAPKRTAAKTEPVTKTKPPAEIKPQAEPTKPESETIHEENFEKLKQITHTKATEDAKTLADLYFKTFVEEFNKNITQKLSEFKTNIDKFFQGLS